MLCKYVLPLLSEFYDEALDADATVRVSQHLEQCAQCRKELDALSVLHGKLNSLKGMQAPDYLGSLIKHKIIELRQDSWYRNLRNELERTWSIIRTTEGMWYISKALGTVMTSLFFILISSSSIPPSYLAVPPAVPEVVQAGTPQAPRRRAKSDPVINDLCLYTIGESMSQAGKDEAFSVLYGVDPGGVATIQDVIESPKDRRVLNSANEMISSTRLRPASEKGKAVPSHLLLMFYKMTVHE